MKIGIVGLRPRQITEVQQRNLPVEILFYGEKAQTADAISRFSQDKDRVIIMAGHVARPIISAVAKEKREVITGSVSAVIRLLEELIRDNELRQAPHRQEQFTSPKPAPMREVVSIDTEVREEVEPTTTPPPQPEKIGFVGKVARAINIQPKPERPIFSDVLLASQVPRGYTSAYTTPVSPRVTLRSEREGRMDYAPLRALGVGEVARVKRPPGLSMEQWQTRINAIRSYHARAMHMALEAHFYDGHVDLLVLSRTHGLPQAPTPPAVTETTPPPAADQQQEAEVLGGEVESTDEERELWKQSMLAIVSRGIVPAEAAALADAVIVEFRTRYRP